MSVLVPSNQDGCRELQKLQAPIYRLHAELVQLLAKCFLEPFEAALLAICSKEFRRILGTQYWKICRDVDQGNKLLSVWEKDFPEMIHCIPCARFHHAKSKPQVNSEWKCQHLERQIRSIGSDFHHARDELRFIYIQAALKRHRLGLDFEQYIKALNLERYSDFTTRTVRRYYSVSEARIISGEVFVRVQDWNFYPAEVLIARFPCRAFRALFLRCSHFMDGSINTELERQLWNASLVWENLGQPNKFDGLRQCRFCETEMQFDIIRFMDLASEQPKKPRLYDRYIATVTTTWANYGNGNPALNGKYRRQFLDEWEIPIKKLGIQHNPVCFEPGSIKNAYENSDRFSFETVVSKEKIEAIKASMADNDERLALLGHPKAKRTDFFGYHY